MALHQRQKPDLEPPSIPDRLYFKIGDVARICSVETYVLRFWESQFPQLKPNKSGTGQRLYRRRDVELALRIKQLVHDEGYTLAGARQVLDQSTAAPKKPRKAALQPPAAPAVSEFPAQPPDAVAATLAQTRTELRQIAAQLANPEPPDQPQTVEPLQAKPQRSRTRVTALPSLTGSLFSDD